MESNRFPKMDRTVYSFASLQDQGDKVKYWKTRTPQERLEALELMRQAIYGYDPVTTRMDKSFFGFVERQVHD